MSAPRNPSPVSTALASAALLCAALGSGLVGALALQGLMAPPLPPIPPPTSATPVVLGALPSDGEPFRRYPLDPTPVLVQIVHTPTPWPLATATHLPLVATATARASIVCPEDAAARAALPEGVSCRWDNPPTRTPVPTPLPACETPVPGKRCDPHGGA